MPPKLVEKNDKLTIDDALNLAAKLALNNRVVPHLNRIYIREGSLVAANAMNLVLVSGLSQLDGIEALVDTEALVNSLGKGKGEVTLELTKDILSIARGSVSALIVCDSLTTNPFKQSYSDCQQVKMMGAAGDFLNAVRDVKAFMKQSNIDNIASQLFVFNEHVYATDNTRIARQRFKGVQQNCVLTKSFVDLVAAIKLPNKGFFEDERSFGLIFDGLIVRTVKLRMDTPEEIAKMFDPFKTVTLKPLPEPAIEPLKELCKIANKEVLEAGPKGIELASRTRSVKLNTDVPLEFPRFQVKANVLLELLNNKAQFSWRYGTFPAFAFRYENGVEGLVSTRNVVPTK